MYLTTPQRVEENRCSLLGVVQVAAAGDQSFAVTSEGIAYSWGFNESYQCGQGWTIADIADPDALVNSAVREKNRRREMRWAVFYLVRER